MYIYKLTNKKNGKIYIGQSCRNPEIRWEEHVKSVLSTDEQQRTYLQNAINKDKWENFDKEIIEVIPIERGQSYLDEREVFNILEYQTFHKWGKGYNLTLGGRGTKGSSCRVEKQKQSDKQQDTYDYANYNVKTGELVNVYTNVRDAAKGVGGSSYEWVSRASDWIIGKAKYATKTYKGYIWMKLPNGSTFPPKINIKTWDIVQKPDIIKSQPRDKEVTSDKKNYEIAQYDTMGDLKKIWPNNLRLIEREFSTFFPGEKVTYNSIINNIKGKSFTAHGYFWKRNKIGESPNKIPVMSEYQGFEIDKKLFLTEPILKINKFGDILKKFKSIYEIPSNLYTNYDKIEIFKIAKNNSRETYKDYYWIFDKNVN
jgi:group I intron endonuclease